MTGQKKAKDLTGERFGRLVVLWRGENIVEPSGATRSAWLCVCDCGETKTVSQHSLSRGLTRSCGCLARERPPKHGMSRSQVYKHWVAMRQRCQNPNHWKYADYGGRGIKVCARWEDFANFLADMGEPEAGMTLDRIDVDGDYEPSNVKWASRREQANNRRNNTTLTYAGKTLTAAEWGRVTGLGKSAIIRRLSRGWPVERVLTEPLKTK